MKNVHVPVAGQKKNNLYQSLDGLHIMLINRIIIIHLLE